MTQLPPPTPTPAPRQDHPLTARQLVEILAAIAGIIIVGVMLLEIDAAGGAAAAMLAVIAVGAAAIWLFARWTTKRSNRKFAERNGRG